MHTDSFFIEVGDGLTEFDSMKFDLQTMKDKKKVIVVKIGKALYYLKRRAKEIGEAGEYVIATTREEFNTLVSSILSRKAFIGPGQQYYLYKKR